MPSRNEGQKWLGPIQAGVEANQNQGNRPLGMPPLSEIKTEAQRMGLTDQDAEVIFNHWMANGFRNKVGRIKSWRHAMQNWKINGYFPSQKAGPSRGTPQFDPPSQDTLLDFCRSKKMTTSHGLRIYRYLVAHGWRYYGNQITNNEQWQAICMSHNFNDR